MPDFLRVPNRNLSKSVKHWLIAAKLTKNRHIPKRLQTNLMGGASGREATAGGPGALGGAKRRAGRGTPARPGAKRRAEREAPGRAGAKRRTERARSDRGPSPGEPDEAAPTAPVGGRAGGGRQGSPVGPERSGGRTGESCRPENANGATEWRPASPARGCRRHGKGEKQATTGIV